MRDADNRRLVVWGEKKKDPDWDEFLSALLDYAFREVEAGAREERKSD